MKKHFTEEQILQVLTEVCQGAKIGETCRKHGISEVTYYKWKKKFGGMSTSEVKRFRVLEAENRHLKTLLADSMLEIKMIKDVLSKKW